MEQHVININQQLAYLMSTGKWRNCQRKAYNVFAIQPEAGFVFANMLEQPQQYQYIKQRFNKAVVHVSKLTEEDKKTLGNNCYITDGTKVVICGTRGELWTVKPEKLQSSYTKVDGTPINEIPKQWHEFSRAQEGAPSAKGIQIPKQYLGVYEAPWGTLTMNDPHSRGHYSGDILVVSLDGKDVSTINNEVFACTFNQQVGGWAQSGSITPADKIKQICLEDVSRVYAFEASARAKKSLAEWKISEVHKCGSTVLWYVLDNKDGRHEDRVDKTKVVSYIKSNSVANARVQEYNGREIVRLAKDSYRVVEEAINTNVAAPESRKGAVARVTAVLKREVNGNAIGYAIDYKGKETNVSKNKLVEYIKQNRIANARLQEYNGREIIRLDKEGIEVRIIGSEETEQPVAPAEPVSEGNRSSLSEDELREVLDYLRKYSGSISFEPKDQYEFFKTNAKNGAVVYNGKQLLKLAREKSGDIMQYEMIFICDYIKAPRYCNELFAYFRADSISIMDPGAFDTSQTVSVELMFAGCKATSLSLLGLDTSNVTRMRGVFMGCNANQINIAFDTHKAADMSRMFEKCHTERLDLSKFDTRNVTNMNRMFYGCITKDIKLSSFNTSNVVTMYGMFAGCQVDSLDLSSFDTRKVTDMARMFSECHTYSIDLSSFDARNVTDMQDMFFKCGVLVDQIKSPDDRINEQILNYR